MDISIIVPVYNVEKYLDRCLESLLEQEKVETEILIIDDGSTDNSGKISDIYQKNTIIYMSIIKKMKD
jgi:glycosyltransferase involved in cell wall biosynthesis